MTLLSKCAILPSKNVFSVSPAPQWSVLCQAVARDVMHAIVIPLLKCQMKDPSNLNCPRAFAIATTIYNVLEQILLARLQMYVTAYSLFGFSEDHIRKW